MHPEQNAKVIENLLLKSVTPHFSLYKARTSQLLTLLGLPHPGTEMADTICLPDADIVTLYYIYAMCTILFIFQ